MINISQLQDLLQVDPKLLNQLDIKSELLEEQVDFDQILQASMVPEVMPMTKNDLAIAQLRQMIAAEDLQVEDLEALGIQISPEALKSLMQKESPDQLLQDLEAYLANQPVAMHDVVVPPPHAFNPMQAPIAVVAPEPASKEMEVVKLQLTQSTGLVSEAGDLKMVQGQLTEMGETLKEGESVKTSSLKSPIDDRLELQLQTKDLKFSLEKLKMDAQLEKMGHSKQIDLAQAIPVIVNQKKGSQAGFTHESAGRIDHSGLLGTQSRVNQSAVPFNQMVQSDLQQPIKQDASWGQNLNERLIMMARNGLEKALIQIDPPELGPIEVKVDLDGPSASLHFTTHHQGVKDLIEGQLAQLRQSFEAAGMNLVDVNVENQQGQGGFEQAFQSPTRSHEPLIQESRRQDSDGLLDVYV